VKIFAAFVRLPFQGCLIEVLNATPAFAVHRRQLGLSPLILVQLSRNFPSLTQESTALVLLFCEFIGVKVAHLIRIEHTTARFLSHALKLGGAAVLSFSCLR
ncbi:MAG TPA: hypothetical protein VLL94_09235, partial [Nitrospiraceae bacterium]|nr:hypothetical protein [Nitrospiraceae bacterium]